MPVVFVLLREEILRKDIDTVEPFHADIKDLCDQPTSICDRLIVLLSPDIIKDL
jgi:hypothetical protein